MRLLVIEDLKFKNPPSAELVLQSLIKGPVQRVLSQEFIFENIDGNLIYKCSKNTYTSGVAGPGQGH